MNFLSVGPKTVKTYLARSVLFGLIGGLGAVGPLRADTIFWSTFASGNARQFEITCSTCPNPVTTLSSLSDGGFGNRLASVEFANGDLVSYSAIAAFRGPNSLPRLGAVAIANISVVPSPISPSTFFHAASAAARATQQYLYTGATPMDYKLQYDIDGHITGGVLTEIAGGFTVFGSGFNPNREVNPTLGSSFDHVNGDGTEKPVHLSGSVTFSVNPGDDFFVQSTLDTFADSRSQQLFASADAFHTLDMSFTQGDTSLLVPAATTPFSSVPEPASAVLSLMGVAGIVIAARRRRSMASTVSGRGTRDA
jgi:hypothetical protein